jgi:voltage-gated potassium channel Kch
MSKGTIAPLVLLAFAGIIFIGIIAGILFFTNSIPYSSSHIPGINTSEGLSFFDVIWITLLRMLDPGVISNDPPNSQFIIFMFLATLAGIFMVSVLIGFVNSGVMQKITNLRKGKSFVVESNHTVILGWSFQVFPVINEIIVANENQNYSSIVILAEKDKVEMEDEIKSKVGKLGSTRIVCRTGNPIDLHDLEIVNPHYAKSIIVIASDSEEPDSIVIKTILAITNNPNRRPAPHKYHIVAEIRDPRNVPIAKIAGKDEVQLVVFDDVISRITAQTCRQPGLSVVFTELLDFSGDEIYFQEEHRLVGRSFIESLFAFETSTIIGLRKRNGNIMVKPPFDTAIEEGDRLIAISEDDDTILLSGKMDYQIDHSAVRKPKASIEQEPESTLILGWNRRAPLIISELDYYTIAGSNITIVAEYKYIENELALINKGLKNQVLHFHLGDPTNRQILDELGMENFNHVVVLSQTELSDVQSTDARTLSTLLHLRDIADNKGHKFSIVSEMLDDRNRELAEITHTDDFIVSVKLDSLMLSQISENRELKTVFELLFSAGGPAIYIKPVENYVELGRPVNFYTIMESAREQNQIAIGYKLSQAKRRYEANGNLGHGVVVNPVKSRQVFFSEGDKIIVLLDEEKR